MLPSSANHPSVTLSSGGSGFSTTTGLTYYTYLELEPPHSPPHRQRQSQSQTTPSICVFSGLPLFPPENETEKAQNTNSPLDAQQQLSAAAVVVAPFSIAATTSSPLPPTPPPPPIISTSATSASMEMEYTMATAWIDDIIKNLIHSTTNHHHHHHHHNHHVSIPQLIQNVREIIHPCNPNLAALLEYRLWSLSDLPLTDPIPILPDYSEGESIKEAAAEKNAAGKVHIHHHHHQNQQGQVQQGSSGFKLYIGSGCGLDNLSYHLPDTVTSHAMNQYLNMGITLPATMTSPNTIFSSGNVQQTQHLCCNPMTSPCSIAPPPPVISSSSSQVEQSTAIVTTTRLKKKEEIRRQQQHKRDEEGLHLLTLLLKCADAVAADNFEEANKMLLEISEMSTPVGTSAQRVAAYFSEAMSARLVNSYLGIYETLVPRNQTQTQTQTQQMVSAFQVFNGISPLVKFSHFTANQAIQEALEREDRVHIIDLDIMQGMQWPGLFHVLASRPGGPPFVRLTGLGTSMDSLEATGKRLSDFAHKLGLPFEFSPVADKVGNLDPERLNVSKRDAVAIHWLQHSLYDVTGSDTNALWLFQRLAPKVVTVVEQDLRHAGSFLERFVEAIHYYSAMFDSLGASYGEESKERHVVEQQLLSREIRNILAVGGLPRSRINSVDDCSCYYWREKLQQCGFKGISLAGNATAQATLLLGMFPNNNNNSSASNDGIGGGYTLVEENGTLKLGWKDLCLLTASAWRWRTTMPFP
ncbi:unnamed protein product [Camellia sinensis]